MPTVFDYHVTTLETMFPQLSRNILSHLLKTEGGDVEKVVDRILSGNYSVHSPDMDGNDIELRELSLSPNPDPQVRNQEQLLAQQRSNAPQSSQSQQAQPRSQSQQAQPRSSQSSSQQPSRNEESEKDYPHQLSDDFLRWSEPQVIDPVAEMIKNDELLARQMQRMYLDREYARYLQEEALSQSFYQAHGYPQSQGYARQGHPAQGYPQGYPHGHSSQGHSSQGHPQGHPQGYSQGYTSPQPQRNYGNLPPSSRQRNLSSNMGSLNNDSFVMAQRQEKNKVASPTTIKKKISQLGDTARRRLLEFTKKFGKPKRERLIEFDDIREHDELH